MRIIPVIDLAGGEVVHAVAGERDAYQPVTSVLTTEPSPGAIGKALVDVLGATEAYVADLDAIRGAEPDWPLYHEIAAGGLRLWIDAGLSSRQRAARFSQGRLENNVVSRVVVGLESVQRPEDLAALFHIIGPERFTFSLDLRDGQLDTTEVGWRRMNPVEVATLVVEVGVRSLIVLDLARVGTGRGVGTDALCRQLRDRWPELNLIAGGGIRDLQDLRTLARSGCDAALVASALHDGRFTAERLQRDGYTF